MTVELTPTDFRTLVALLARDVQFRDVTSRVRLVSAALEGEPRGEQILPLINLDGSPQGVAVEVIRRLANFGRVTAEKEALGILLNYLLLFMGPVDADALFLRQVIESYHLDKPVLPGVSLSTWRGSETPAQAQEKIIGEDTLRHVRILELALEAARAVLHITLPDGYGSGFMIAPDLLITNHHVISSPAEGAGSLFTFSYELDRAGAPRATQAACAAPGGVFYTNKALDYTILQLADPPAFGDPLPLRARAPRAGSRVNIIQHPAGHYKKISMQNNFVAFADQNVVQYSTSTLPGSSGSPVFDDDFSVIAVHHSGGMLREPTTGQVFLRNEGISAAAILKDLQASAPDIFTRLT